MKCEHADDESVKIFAAHAFPPGGSFPLTGCRPCLDELNEDLGGNAVDIYFEIKR